VIVGHMGKEDHSQIFLWITQVGLLFWSLLILVMLLKMEKSVWVVGQHGGWNWRGVCCPSSYRSSF